MFKTLFLIYRYQDTFVRLDVTPNGFIHSFGFVSGDPYLMSLFAGLNTNIFKEIEFLFYKAVNGDSSITESPSADSTQVIFHVATPLRFVTMYSFFSNFWRICSSIECFISLELASVKPCRVGIAHQKMGNCMD